MIKNIEYQLFFTKQKKLEIETKHESVSGFIVALLHIQQHPSKCRGFGKKTPDMKYNSR